MAADFIPLTPAATNYRLRVPLDDQLYLFDIRWNSRDQAFYMDVLNIDETPIVHGLKLVLGASPGRTRAHKFFIDHMFRMIDSTGEGVDATFDDIGKRVNLLHLSRLTLMQADV